MYQAGDFAVCGRRDVAAPRGVGKRVDTCGFYPLNSRFPLFVSLAQTRERRPLRKGERQSGYHSVSFATCSQFTDRLLLHRVRHCYAAPSVELPVCVAERYLTLRIRGYMDGYQSSCGRKNPLPFLYSLSSANFAVLRGNGEIHKRGTHSLNPRTAREKGLVAYGQTLVSTLLCARATSAQIPFASQVTIPCFT